MGYWFVCPECYKILDLDDFGNSGPTAKVKLVDGKHCGNCRCDLTSSYKDAMHFLSKEQRQSESDKSDQD